MAHLAVCQLLLLLLLQPPPAPAQPSSSSSSDAERLLAFKATLENGGTALADWVAGTSPCTRGWTGVSCNSKNRVDRIILKSFGLHGTIPAPSGWALPDGLRELDLRNNPALFGPIPPAWKLPEGLQVLQLQNITLGGTLSAEWAAQLPTELVTLRLDGSSLTGSLPSDFDLPKVVQFAAPGNQLSGTLPQWKMPAAQQISLHSNKLSGSIPSSFIYSTSAAYFVLTLDQNNLSGSLPSGPDLPISQVVILPGNPKLCGELPENPLYLRADFRGAYSDFLPVPRGALPACSGPDGGQPSSDSDSGGSSAAVIAGAVAGVVGGTALIALAVLAFRNARLRNRVEKRAEDMEVDLTGTGPGERDASRPGSSQGMPFSLVCSSGRKPGARMAESIELSNDALLASINTCINSGLSSGSGSSQLSRGSLLGVQDSMRHLSLGVNVEAYVIPWPQLKIKKQIGRGASGRVYLCHWRDTVVAAKLLFGPGMGDESDMAVIAKRVLSVENPVLANLKTEANLLAALRHPNVTSFMGLCLQPPVIVMEYYSHGSLYDVLKRARESSKHARQLSWALRLNIALGAAKGMMYLHSLTPSPVLHRDLKSPNLLLDASYNAKVSDFNLSRILGESSLPVQSSTAAGNPRWLAPEVLEGGSHSLASDVFSFGIILWELMTLSAPWEGVTNLWQVSSAVIQGQRPAVPAEPAQLQGGTFEGLGAYTRLMEDCWAQDPAARPSFQEVVHRLREVIETRLQPHISSSTPEASPCPPALEGRQPGNIEASASEVRRAIQLAGQTHGSPFKQAAAG